jgi:hypothetical protein
VNTPAGYDFRKNFRYKIDQEQLAIRSVPLSVVKHLEHAAGLAHQDSVSDRIFRNLPRQADGKSCLEDQLGLLNLRSVIQLSKIG